MNHFVHCCSFSTSNKITSKGCQSASQTCDFDAKMQNFSGEGDSPLPTPLPQWGLGRGHPLPTPHPLGAAILTPPILKFCYTLLLAAGACLWRSYVSSPISDRAPLSYLNPTNWHHELLTAPSLMPRRQGWTISWYFRLKIPWRYHDIKSLIFSCQPCSPRYRHYVV